MIHHRRRLIAMLDILGFSSSIADPDRLEALSAELSDAIEYVSNEVLITKATGEDRSRDRRNFECWHFVFDNVVLVSHDLQSSRWAASSFLAGVHSLLHSFAAMGFPLRGAVSYGDYVQDEVHGVFLSDAFKRLSTAEQAQEWSGCIVLPEAEDIVREQLVDEAPTRLSTIVRYQPPLKKVNSGNASEYYCFNWLAGTDSQSRAEVLQGLAGGGAKQANTAAFAEHCLSLPDFRHQLPDEFEPARYVRYSDWKAGMTTYAFFDEKDLPVPGPARKHWAHNPYISDSRLAFVAGDTAEECEALSRQRGWR